MRLLILADESRSRRSLAHLFTELGHTVAAVPVVSESLARLQGERFDLVVVELRTPRGDAMKLLRAARRQQPETPMVVVSGSDRVRASVQELGLAPVTFLPEPVGPGRVAAVLRRVEAALPAQRAAIAEAELLAPARMPDETHPVSPAAVPHELGEGRLTVGLPNGPVQKVLRIDATDAPPNLLVRLLVGSYITGQDQVLITARHGLTEAQRNEIHHLVDRTLGMSVVGDSTEVVEVQNFIDPGKHELPRLLHRVAQMLRTELDVCRSALLGKGPPQLALIETIEEEIDRFYLLMVRQLLLSSDNPRMARNIDVESHHFQIGYRLVAKVLEMTGDLIQGIGVELQRNLPGMRRLPNSMLHEFVTRLERLDHLLTRTMDAFDRLSVIDANATLNVIGEMLPKDASFGQRICHAIPNRRVAISAQRIASHLDMALEMLIIMNEVTINRCVEPETVARMGTRVATVPRAVPPAPKHASSRTS
ncbi:MAG TPA: response regulator [Thermoplasmata archaeon]|nr:response regulator [Thermoplasmata archaeon]HYB78733.1 response regulator [Thermoplasmata archaeon]